MSVSFDQLPNKVGKATVNWFGSDRENPFFPSRSERTITMSASKLVSIHPLKKGDQYLVHYGKPIGTVLFGTDEEVFLTGVTQKAYDAFIASGEMAFFDILKPGVIRQLEHHGIGPTKRQGDIWVCRVADDWSRAITSPLFSNLARPLKKPFCDIHRWSLQGTRHEITGDMAKIHMFSLVTNGVGPKRKKRKPSASYHSYVLLKGIINAPDHAPLHATDGIYLMARTENTSDIIARRYGGD